MYILVFQRLLGIPGSGCGSTVRAVVLRSVPISGSPDCRNSFFGTQCVEFVHATYDMFRTFVEILFLSGKRAINVHA